MSQDHIQIDITEKISSQLPLISREQVQQLIEDPSSSTLMNLFNTYNQKVIEESGDSTSTIASTKVKQYFVNPFTVFPEPIYNRFINADSDTSIRMFGSWVRDRVNYYSKYNWLQSCIGNKKRVLPFVPTFMKTFTDQYVEQFNANDKEEIELQRNEWCRKFKEQNNSQLLNICKNFYNKALKDTNELFEHWHGKYDYVSQQQEE